MPGRAVPAIALAWAALAGCRQDMHDQAKVEALEGSNFFEDGRGSRPLVAGTVPRGGLRLDAHDFTGRVGEAFADAFPAAVTRESLVRGRERYDIFCAPCHDRVGNGLGMIVRRGFRRPPSLHIDRLQLTKALSNEWAGKGVNVNAIAPGYMRTDNTAALQADPVRSKEILARIPANRWGEPSDLEGAVVFLASPASDYLHGHIMVVDGGWCGR